MDGIIFSIVYKDSLGIEFVSRIRASNESEAKAIFVNKYPGCTLTKIVIEAK